MARQKNVNHVEIIMKSERSAGAVVYRDTKKGREYLLLKHSRKELVPREYWSFPKGHIEEGQSTQQAALREVREEGGIDAEIIVKVGENKYVYSLNGEKIFKMVTLFLMKYVSGNIKNHDWEVSEAIWVNPEEALKILSFDSDKKLLKKALEIRNG